MHPNRLQARNDLIKVNLFVSSGALVFGFGAMLGGFFGMNVDVEASTESWGFASAGLDRFETVTLGIVSGAAGLGFACYQKYVALNRVAAPHVGALSSLP